MVALDQAALEAVRSAYPPPPSLAHQMLVLIVHVDYDLADADD